MTPDIDQLREDINKAAHAAGTNAFVRDVLKRSHRAIGDLGEMSAICESGCDRALDMLEVSTAACKALGEEVERLRAERLKLDKRIHNQRVALRDTWETVEMRRKWLGSDTARKRIVWLSKHCRELQSQLRDPGQG